MTGKPSKPIEPGNRIDPVRMLLTVHWLEKKSGIRRKLGEGLGQHHCVSWLIDIHSLDKVDHSSIKHVEDGQGGLSGVGLLNC